MREKPIFRKFIALFVSLVMLVVIAGCVKQGESTTSKTTSSSLEITIADIVTNPIFQVAISEGIFDKHHIKANIATFATPAEGINALFINQVQVAYGADFPY